MLSIGKLAPGQARYYLDQAEGRVDVVQSIGDGIEDYYAGGAEARGEWLGAAARTLGLDGPADGEALRRVLRGNDPWSDEPLRTGRGRATVAGFDLTFSAPKSVSVLFGVGDPDVTAAVRQAHEQAVREAFGYMERSAAAVRRGRGGAAVHQAGGLVAAAFRHRTSRMGDPQLHTHVLVANLGRGPDARWSALDARRIYAHARVASFVYQAVLRGELTRELGVEWTPVRDGIAEIDGVPPQVLRAFSRRRAQIEEALVEHGAGGARAAEAAALATRRRKSASLDGEALRWQWRDCAAGLGFDADNIARLLRRVRGHALDSIRLAALRTELAGRRGLTYRRSSFGRRDVLLELCERLPPGTTVTARELEDGADAFLSSSRVVPLAGDRGLDADSFRGPDGRRLPVATDERRYSTPRAAGGRAEAGRARPSLTASGADRRPRRRRGNRRTTVALGGAACDGAASLRTRRPRRADHRQGRHGQDVRARRRARGLGERRDSRSAAPRSHDAHPASCETARVSRARASPHFWPAASCRGTSCSSSTRRG